METVTVVADVKLHSAMPSMNVDVCFRDHDELQALIGALQHLLEESTRAVRLVYLSNDAGTDDGLPTEVCFHTPGYVRDEIDRQCLAAARKQLESFLPPNREAAE
jgi:hypothetical protein